MRAYPRRAMLYGTIRCRPAVRAVPRCRALSGGTPHWPALRDPRAPTRRMRSSDISTIMRCHINENDSTRTPARIHQNLQFDTTVSVYLPRRMSSTGSHTIIVEIIVEYALGLRLSHIIRLTVTAHRFRVSGLPPATISSLCYRPGADSSSASSQMCPRTRRGRE